MVVARLGNAIQADAGPVKVWGVFHVFYEKVNKCRKVAREQKVRTGGGLRALGLAHVERKGKCLES